MGAHPVLACFSANTSSSQPRPAQVEVRNRILTEVPGGSSPFRTSTSPPPGYFQSAPHPAEPGSVVTFSFPKQGRIILVVRATSLCSEANQPELRGGDGDGMEWGWGGDGVGMW